MLARCCAVTQTQLCLPPFWSACLSSCCHNVVIISPNTASRSTLLPGLHALSACCCAVTQTQLCLPPFWSACTSACCFAVTQTQLRLPPFWSCMHVCMLLCRHPNITLPPSVLVCMPVSVSSPCSHHLPSNSFSSLRPGLQSCLHVAVLSPCSHHLPSTASPHFVLVCIPVSMSMWGHHVVITSQAQLPLISFWSAFLSACRCAVTM